MAGYAPFGIPPAAPDPDAAPAQSPFPPEVMAMLLDRAKSLIQQPAAPQPSAADQAAMSPETYANPMVSQMIGSLATLPKRAIDAAGHDFANRGTGAEPQLTGPALEAGMLPMGTGVVTGVPVRAGETVLSAGAARSLKLVDDGAKINISPEGMKIPDYGKGMSWGLTAYRTTPQAGVHAGTPALKIRDVRLPEELQGQGNGLALYEQAARLAADEGRAFHSDSTVTKSAVGPWAALKRRGYDVQTSPNVIDRQGPPEAPHLSRYETANGDPVFYISPRGIVREDKT